MKAIFAIFIELGATQRKIFTFPIGSKARFSLRILPIGNIVDSVSWEGNAS
jgi:hypothetical protein